MTPEQVRSTPSPFVMASQPDRYMDRGWRAACAAIADALDRESAEQGQAINRAWLESIGFIESVRSAVTLRLPADDDLFIWHEGGKWRPAFEQGFAGYIRLALCSTRGDVLRLLAALGINVERGGE